MLKLIHPKETLPLRSAQLRNGAALEACVFDADNRVGTFHMGYFVEQQVEPIVILTLQREDLPNLNADGRGYRLRGMATHAAFQGKGYGRQALQNAIAWIYRHGLAQYIWCHARAIAYPFYESLGFEKWGEPFSLPKIGVHQVMWLNACNRFTMEQKAWEEMEKSKVALGIQVS
jgi:GNAT superfamily N-acetyltransferase